MSFLQELRVIDVGRALAKLVPSRADATFEIWNHAAHMVGDDLEVGKAVEQSLEHDVRHRDARLVGPAERPPDLVMALLLLLVVGEVRAARRMEPDRQVELRHQLEQRKRLRCGERFAENVGEDLHARRTEITHCALRFLQEPIGIVHGKRRDEGGKTRRMLAHELRHAVVGKARHVGGHGRRSEDLDRRRTEADHLSVVVELIHDAEAGGEIDDCRDFAHALVHILAVRRDLEHPIVERLRENMIEDVEFHRGPSIGFDTGGADDFRPALEIDDDQPGEVVWLCRAWDSNPASGGSRALPDRRGWRSSRR